MRSAAIFVKPSDAFRHENVFKSWCHKIGKFVKLYPLEGQMFPPRFLHQESSAYVKRVSKFIGGASIMKNERLLVIVIFRILKNQQVNPMYVPIKAFAIAIFIKTKSDAIMIAMPTTVLK